MSGPILGAVLVIGIIALYFITYIGNSKIAAPEGVAPVDKCSTCGSGACSIDIKEKYLSGEIEECAVFDDEQAIN